MIHKSGDYKNGYIFGPNSTDSQFQRIISKDYGGWDNIKCIICNQRTKQNFQFSMNGYSILTINNKLVDGVFFVNHVF